MIERGASGEEARADARRICRAVQDAVGEGWHPYRQAPIEGAGARADDEGDLYLLIEIEGIPVALRSSRTAAFDPEPTSLRPHRRCSSRASRSAWCRTLSRGAQIIAKDHRHPPKSVGPKRTPRLVDRYEKYDRQWSLEAMRRFGMWL
jgi:hypothetical protein